MLPREQDTIRQLAEEELGRLIPDERWTTTVRDTWKIYLHGRNYGCSVKQFKNTYGVNKP